MGLKGKNVFLRKTCKNDPPPPTPPLLPCPRLQRSAADCDAPQELLSPLRAVNGLPLLLGPMQLAAAAEMEAKRPPPPPSPLLRSPSAATRDSADLSISSSPTSMGRAAANAVAGMAAESAATASASATAAGAVWAVTSGLKALSIGTGPEFIGEEDPEAGGSDGEEEDGAEAAEEATQGEADIGLMALWGLLNMSGFSAAQVAICRQGLYTLLAVVHRSRDPNRSSAAAAILNNIQFHPSNITVLYKAELRLKQAALTQLEGECGCQSLIRARWKVPRFCGQVFANRGLDPRSEYLVA